MLVWILTGGALVCLVYYLVIILYSGIGTNFAFIWLRSEEHTSELQSHAY